MFNDDDDDLDITEIDPALLDGKAPVSSQNTGEKDDRTINHKDSVKTEPVSRSQRCMFHCVITVVFFLCYAKNNIRDLKQRRRRRQGRHLEKNEFIFYRRISHMPRSVQYVYRSQNLLKLNMQCQGTIPKKIRKISRRRSRSPKYPELGHFTLSFYRGRLRNVPRITTHVHSYCSAH